MVVPLFQLSSLSDHLRKSQVFQPLSNFHYKILSVLYNPLQKQRHYTRHVLKNLNSYLQFHRSERFVKKVYLSSEVDIYSFTNIRITHVYKSKTPIAQLKMFKSWSQGFREK